MIRNLLVALCLLLTVPLAHADEGMWLPLLLSSLNAPEMQAMGMKMSADDIYSVNHGSLKDAVVLFGGFCTGEVISEQGLLLTNHHCGYGAIQSHSTVENNLLKNGFWAKTHQEELPNPGLYVTFIVRIEDVTAAALNGVTDAMNDSLRQSVIDQNLHVIRDTAAHESFQDVMTKPFYEGNQYFLFVSETYSDVRLVGAPPESIGKFGADTDNWEWPRHTGDFSIFRVYAGPDNKPAAYSPDNVPLHPKHALPISLAGVKEGDFTMVFGFPGRTDEYLTSYAVQQIVDVIDPARTGIRGITLEIMDKAMRQDEATRLKLAPRFAGLANSWKKWLGERQGLIRTGAVGIKRAQEEDFKEQIRRKRKLANAYSDVLPQFETLYSQTNPLEKARIYYSETFGVNVQLFQLIARLDRLRRIYESNGEDAFHTAAEQYSNWAKGFYDGFDCGLDRQICQALFLHMSSTLESKFLPEELDQKYLFTHGYTLADFTATLYSPQMCDSMAMAKISGSMVPVL